MMLFTVALLLTRFHRAYAPRDTIVQVSLHVGSISREDRSLATANTHETSGLRQERQLVQTHNRRHPGSEEKDIRSSNDTVPMRHEERPDSLVVLRTEVAKHFLQVQPEVSGTNIPIVFLSCLVLLLIGLICFMFFRSSSGKTDSMEESMGHTWSTETEDVPVNALISQRQAQKRESGVQLVGRRNMIEIKSHPTGPSGSVVQPEWTEESVMNILEEHNLDSDAWTDEMLGYLVRELSKGIARFVIRGQGFCMR